MLDVLLVKMIYIRKKQKNVIYVDLKLNKAFLKNIFIIACCQCKLLIVKKCILNKNKIKKKYRNINYSKNKQFLNLKKDQLNLLIKKNTQFSSLKKYKSNQIPIKSHLNIYLKII